MTLGSAPKAVATVLAMVLFGSWSAKVLGFTREIILSLPTMSAEGRTLVPVPN